MGGTLEAMSAFGSAATGAAAVGGFASGLIGGYLQNKQAEKAQAFQEKWANLLYENEVLQQALQNRMDKEKLGMTKAQQYFNNQLSLRNEARNRTADWHTYMQNAANKYAEVLNKSRALQKANAAALRNR